EPGTPEPVRAKALEHLTRLLPNKWGNLRNSPEMVEAISRLLRRNETIEAGLSLAEAGGGDAVVARVNELAADPDRPLPLRQRAVAALGQIHTESALRGIEDALPDAGPLGVDLVRALGEHVPSRGRSRTAGQALAALQRVITGDGFSG